MKLVVILLTGLLLAFSADGQSCAGDCRIVCGNDLPAGPTGTLRRGKHGPKGQKGEVGLPGKDGADNSKLVGSTLRKMKSCTEG